MARWRGILGVFLGILLLGVSGFEFDALDYDSLERNQVVTLKWTPSDNRKVGLWLYNVDSSSFSLIGDHLTNIGAYTWTVPSNIKLNVEYKFYIRDDDDEEDYALSDAFRIEGTSSHTSTSASSSSTTKSTSTRTTTTSTSTSVATTTPAIPETQTTLATTITTTTTSAAAAGTAPAAASASPTDPVSNSSSSVGSSTSKSDSGLSSSGKVALIVCLVLGVPLALLALLFWYFTRRHPPDTNSSAGNQLVAFTQWLFRCGYPQSGPIHHPIESEDTAAEKGMRDVSVMSEFSSSPAISQGVRSSQATQNTELWHYKPELPGSDPLRESSVQFLPPVELPAWTPEELDSSRRGETAGERDGHEKTGSEENDPQDRAKNDEENK